MKEQNKENNSYIYIPPKRTGYRLSKSYLKDAAY